MSASATTRDGPQPGARPDPRAVTSAGAQADQPTVRQHRRSAPAGLAVAVLLILVYYTARQGASQLSFSFLTAQLPAPPGIGTGGGMGPAIVGSIEVVLIATIIALPVGCAHRALSLRIRQQGASAGFSPPHSSRWLGLPTIIVGRLHRRTDRRALPGQSGIAAGPRPRDRRGAADRAREPRVDPPRTRFPCARARPTRSAWRGRRTTVGVILPHRLQRHRHRRVLADRTRRRRDGAGAGAADVRTHSSRRTNWTHRHAVPTVPMEILGVLGSS